MTSSPFKKQRAEADVSNELTSSQIKADHNQTTHWLIQQHDRVVQDMQKDN